MQGKDTSENTDASLDNLQSPEFYEGESDVDEPEQSSQLEHLQSLLELAQQNEEDARQQLAKVKDQLKTSSIAQQELKSQLTILTEQNQAQQKTIDEQNGLLQFVEHYEKEREHDHQVELKKTTDDCIKKLNDLHKTFDKQTSELTAENARLRTIILKQNQMLTSKSNEIIQLKASQENSKPYPYGGMPSLLFSNSNLETCPETIFLNKGRKP